MPNFSRKARLHAQNWHRWKNLTHLLCAQSTADSLSKYIMKPGVTTAWINGNLLCHCVSSTRCVHKQNTVQSLWKLQHRPHPTCTGWSCGKSRAWVATRTIEATARHMMSPAVISVQDPGRITNCSTNEIKNKCREHRWNLLSQKEQETTTVKHAPTTHSTAQLSSSRFYIPSWYKARLNNTIFFIHLKFSVYTDYVYLYF